MILPTIGRSSPSYTRGTRWQEVACPNTGRDYPYECRIWRLRRVHRLPTPGTSIIRRASRPPYHGRKRLTRISQRPSLRTPICSLCRGLLPPADSTKCQLRLRRLPVRAPSQRHLDALATNGGETCGLSACVDFRGGPPQARPLVHAFPRLLVRGRENWKETPRSGFGVAHS